jgi:hypothetical protein
MISNNIVFLMKLSMSLCLFFQLIFGLYLLSYGSPNMSSSFPNPVIRTLVSDLCCPIFVLIHAQCEMLLLELTLCISKYTALYCSHQP